MRLEYLPGGRVTMTEMPRVGAETPLIRVDTISKTFRAPRRRLFQPRGSVRALDAVSLEVTEGQSLAIVGESGSGKSTLLRIILGLLAPDSGSVSVDGVTVRANPRDRMLWLREQTGYVSQDPNASLNPRMRVGEIVREPLDAQAVAGNRNLMVAEMLERVGLPKNSVERYPFEFSGGQRQRIAIARALVHRPRVLLGDEPVSALDVLIRASLLELLDNLRQEMGLTLVTVTHDLGIVEHVAKRIVVMRQGSIVESGDVRRVLRHPQDEYTQLLVDAVPRLPEPNV